MRRFWVWLALVSARVYGDEGVVSKQSYLEEVGNMVMTLVFLLIVVMGILYFLKRLTKTRLKYLNKSTAIKIVERRALSSKASLYLVEVYGKSIVISESQGQIRLITEIGQAPPTSLEEEVESEIKLSFKEVLQGKLQQLFKK